MRGHAPTLQIELHRRQAERLAEPQRDQVAHRPAGPQGERQLQLVRRPVADPALDLGRLLRRQQPLAPPRRHPPPVQHAVLALRPVALQPDVHRLPLHAHDLGRLRLAQPLLHDQQQRPPAQFLLRRPTNAAKVPCVHAQSIAGSEAICQVYLWDISNPLLVDPNHVARQRRSLILVHRWLLVGSVLANPTYRGHHQYLRARFSTSSSSPPALKPQCSSSPSSQNPRADSRLRQLAANEAPLRRGFDVRSASLLQKGDTVAG